MNYTVLGALLGALSVAIGAFGAHAMRGRVPPDQLAVFETAVRYQFLHALALLFVGRHAHSAPRTGSGLAGSFFLAGILLFSGSLYLLALTRDTAWGAVTPLGGIAFIAGWLLLARAFWTRG